MNDKFINESLLAEYNDYYNKLLRIFDEEIKKKLSKPLLMHVYPSYTNLENKLMVVGQETKNWYGKLSENKSVRSIINNYKEFELAKKYHSPFWRFNKILFEKLNPGKEANGLLWTNLSKIDQNGKSVNYGVRKTNRAGYELLVKEVEITKPDTIVFLTSWKEDETLKELFTGLKLEKVGDIPFTYLVRLRSNLLLINSFRTYHPRFLNNSKRSKYKIIETINNITNHLI